MYDSSGVILQQVLDDKKNALRVESNTVKKNKCLLYGRDTVENRYFVICGAVNDRVLPIEVVHGE